MRILAIPLAIIGLVIALGTLPSIQASLDERNSYTQQLHQLDLQQRMAAQQEAERARQATQVSRDAMSNIGYLGTGAAVILLLMYMVDFARQRRMPIHRVDGIPVTRFAIEQGATIPMLADKLHAGGIAAIEQARRPNVPQVFSPHYSARNDNFGLPDMAAPALAAPTVPTFSSLLDAGRIGKGNPLVLGYDEADGSEISGTWLDLYSTAIAGMSGTGKTTSQRFLACQTALQGARFAIIDPHQGAAADSLAATLQPLSSAFVCEPASADKAILDVVRYVADVGERRIKGKDTDTTPLILWADELTALLGRSSVGDELAQLLERVAQEYRKRFVFVCGSGQIWTASRTTSELRDSFASVLCHRMKRAQARMLLPTEESATVERLATGHAVLWRTSGATTTIAVPNTTGADVRRVANLLTNDQPTMPRVLVTRSPEVSRDYASDYPAPASVKTMTPEAARIVALFLDGKDAGQVVTELHGLTSKNGTPYMRKLAEVQAVIRAELAQARAA